MTGQRYCTSCGSPIPDGQGNSCSMCYGDIAHGTDGYYQQWAEEREREHDERRQLDERNWEADESWRRDPE